MADPLDLEPIKARLAEATPGPWAAGWSGDPDADGPDAAAPLNVISWNRGEVADLAPHPGCHASTWEQVLRNAELIAHAPSDLQALIAEVERLREPVTWVVSSHAGHGEEPWIDGVCSSLEQARHLVASLPRWRYYDIDEWTIDGAKGRSERVMADGHED